MELGRLLRSEGITPAMIQDNRGLLVNAMKCVFEKESSLAESMPQSYATAPEYHIDTDTSPNFTQPKNMSRLGAPPVLSPMSLLGSAPPRGSGFSDDFLARQDGAASSLDQKDNVDDGMQSLLQGMHRIGFRNKRVDTENSVFEDPGLGDSDSEDDNQCWRWCTQIE